jgi:hypothetical protein
VTIADPVIVSFTIFALLEKPGQAAYFTKADEKLPNYEYF